MTPQQREQLRQQAVLEAMSELVMDSRFQTFMGILADQREIAVGDIKMDDVLSDERRLLATIGEVRCYDNILAAYREYRNREAI